ncbi:unnamed protein product [Colias eurytheme]|nr:unnamed protein product [Colias eurytheme]
MSSNCIKELDFDRGKEKQEIECFADSDEDDLLSQAYEDFLLKDGSNETASGDQTNDADSIFKEKMNNYDLITLEDLFGPSFKTCKEILPTKNKTLVQTNNEESICKENMEDFDMTQDLLVPSNNDVQQSFIVVKTLRDLSLEAINKENLNTADNEEFPESSAIATIILIDIFDKACKRAKQLKRWRIPNPASWKVNVAKKRRAEGSVYAIKNKI